MAKTTAKATDAAMIEELGLGESTDKEGLIVDFDSDEFSSDDEVLNEDNGSDKDGLKTGVSKKPIGTGGSSGRPRLRSHGNLQQITTSISPEYGMGELDSQHRTNSPAALPSVFISPPRTPGATARLPLRGSVLGVSASQSPLALAMANSSKNTRASPIGIGGGLSGVSSRLESRITAFQAQIAQLTLRNERAEGVAAKALEAMQEAKSQEAITASRNAASLRLVSSALNVAEELLNANTTSRATATASNAEAKGSKPAVSLAKKAALKGKRGVDPPAPPSAAVSLASKSKGIGNGKVHGEGGRAANRSNEVSTGARDPSVEMDLEAIRAQLNEVLQQQQHQHHRQRSSGARLGGGSDSESDFGSGSDNEGDTLGRLTGDTVQASSAREAAAAAGVSFDAVSDALGFADSPLVGSLRRSHVLHARRAFEMEERCSRAEARAAVAAERAVHAERQVESARVEINQLLAETGQLRARVVLAEASVNGTSTEKSSTASSDPGAGTGACNGSSSQVSATSGDLQRLRASMQQQLDAEQDKIRSLEFELGREHALSQKLKSKVARMQAATETIVSGGDATRLREVAMQRQQELKATQDQVSRLQTALARADASPATADSSLQEDLDRSMAALKQAQADAELARDQSKHLESQLAIAHDEATSLRRQQKDGAGAVAADLTKLREELALASSRFSSTEEQRQKLEQQLLAANSSAKATVEDKSRLQAELTTYRSKVGELEAALETEREAIVRASGSSGLIQNDLAVRTSELSACQSELEKSAIALGALKESEAAIQSELAASKADLGDMQQKHAAAESKAAKLQTSLDEKLASIADLESSNSSSAATLEQARSDLAKSKAVCTQLAAEANSAKADAAAATAKVKSASAQHSAFQLQLAKLPLQIATIRSELESTRSIALGWPRIMSRLAAGDSIDGVPSDPLLRFAFTLQQAAARQQALMIRARSEAAVARKERRAIHAELQELKGAVRVFVRVRRPMGMEAEPVVTVGGGAKGGVPVAVSGAAAGGGGDPMSGSIASWVEAPVGRRGESRRRWEFDGCFGPDSNQALIWSEIRGLVRSALDGYRVCIFAYGQTGAGKTYTMEGDQSTWGKDADEEGAGEAAAGPGEGVVPRAMRMFIEEKRRAMAGDGTEYSFELAMVEIYCEKLRDLLPASSGPPGGPKPRGGSLPGTDITLREVAGRGVQVQGLEWHTLETTADAIGLLRRGAMARSTGETKMNARSSRSHAVVTLRIKATPPEGTGPGAQVLEGEINLVDLAGSERIARSGAEGQRLKEAQSINTSLSTLGKVIAARATNAKHVPYRESALTRLLSASLDSTGGKAALLAAVSPDVSSAEETASTLGFAAKAKSVELGKAKRFGSQVGPQSSGKISRSGR